ncbi:DUF6519 domain-containing protein [Streptomyces sp. NPDC056512]|uniref:DUF6519 domain-containing protein n=1 Tax=Streptomyces sp. NPDC056512 TaxID=3345846 RepID=UPI0036A74870
MAVISADTFDPLRRFVRVRLQQGVPIVDADVNEREDIQKFELRAFLKWFVGDGVPEGNDGFRIVGTGLPNDFEIRAGFEGASDALHQIGRCLVQGLDVMIEKNLQYTAQPLHESHGASATELADRLKVPVIAKLESINTSTILVYLDVWERLVTPTEDPRLIFDGLGTESCARFKREWVVRARAGTKLPQGGEGDFDPTHAYTALATIERRTGDPLVQPGDVTDRRQRRLLIPPASLIEDVLGTDPADYREGRGRPLVSLREAINALMRGEFPATPDTPVTASPAPQVMSRAFLTDGSGGLVAIWSEEVGWVTQLFVSRMDLSDVRSGFVNPPQRIASGRIHPYATHAVTLPGGDLMVAYQSVVASTWDVTMKRAPLGGLASAAEIPVTATPGVLVDEISPFLTVTGDLTTVFFFRPSTERWHYRRWQNTTNVWKDTGGPDELSTPTGITDSQFHAAVDTDGQVWAAFTDSGGMTVLRFDPDTGEVTHKETFNDGVGPEMPFVLCTRAGVVWVFYRVEVTSQHLGAKTFRAGAWQESQAIVRDGGSEDEEQIYRFNPRAVEDEDGAIWLFWATGYFDEGVGVTAADLGVIRRDPDTGKWGATRELNTSPVHGTGASVAFASVASPKAKWIFWTADRDGVTNIYHKRLVTAV